MRLVVACANDYAGDEGDASIPDASDTGTPVADVIVDAGGGADADACAPRYMPTEGTYAYAHLFSADNLSLGDSSTPTEPFDNPFFATVTHEGNACWRFTAYLADGWDAGLGGHHHSWLFCNACDRAEPSFDLVEETDVFKPKDLPVIQRTTFTCLRPNTYFATDVPIDGSIQQAGCGGSGEGGADNELLVFPQAYNYRGVRTLTYQQAPDAGVEVRVFDRVNRTVFKDGTEQKDDTSSFYFDSATGMLVAADIKASTTTKYGSLNVSYEFFLFFRPVSAAVSPLHRDH